VIFMIFFFSSRRRHTRSKRDWSSDCALPIYQIVEEEFYMKGTMNNMMKQMQKMQKQMVKAQEALMEMEFEASAGGGMVTVKADDRKKMTDVQINEEVVDLDDVEMLQDLVLTAVKDVMKQIEEKSEATMGQFNKGMNMPGMF